MPAHSPDAARFGSVPDDTDPIVAERLLVRYRAMSPSEKAQHVGALNAAVRGAALAGIRQRHPAATHREQQLYLAALLLGDDLVRAAFGWDPEVQGR
jgi:hypothetical protein